MDITRPSGDADGYSAEIAVILGTACPGHCHGSHASTGCSAHWHMVPAPSAVVSAMFMPTVPRFPLAHTAYNGDTRARGAVLYAHFTAVHVSGEARSVTRGVTTCSCSGEVLLSEAQVR